MVCCYVVEDPKSHKITDFISFFHIQSSIIGNSKYDSFTASYCNYYGPAVKLISGETICWGNGSPHLVVDLNGVSKPNKLGVDVQYFSFIDLPVRTFLPGFNWGWRDFADNAEYCNIESGSWHDGSGCGFWIQRHKNMKYLHMTKTQVKKEWKTYK